MTTTLTLLGVIPVIGAMAYRRASLFTATLATAAALVAGTFYGHVPLLVWALFAVIALPLNLVEFRRNQLTKPLFKIYKSIMPEMSRTEKEAIEAGTTWWEADLFAGNPDWKKLHAIPVSTLSAEEQAFMDGPVEEVCRMVNDWEVTHERADLSPEVWQYLKDNKFFAMIIKKKYGGLEFSAYAQSCVLQKLCGASAVLASTVGVPNSLGPGELLQHYGTDEQKDYYLPRLAVGKEIPCFALTSPEAGSDAGSIPDFGIVCKGEWEGEEVLGMRLTRTSATLPWLPSPPYSASPSSCVTLTTCWVRKKSSALPAPSFRPTSRGSTSAVATSRSTCRSRTARPAARTCLYRSTSSSAVRPWPVRAGACWWSVSPSAAASPCPPTARAASRCWPWPPVPTAASVASSSCR